MNIHPIFVHFPIALLTLYSIMEILQFKALRNSRVWKIIKATFLVLGTLGSFAALITGEAAEELLGGNALIEKHSAYGTLSAIVFAVIAVVYSIRLINTENATLKDWFWNTRYVRTAWEVLSRISDFIMDRWYILFVIGIIGLVLISITGALGGAIAYGPDADPFVSVVYHLFF
jgi:uncharacterized membrane protein